MLNFDDEINNIINDIKIIEEQIIFFSNNRRKYNKRVSELENIRKYLLMRLEDKMNKKY